MGQAFLYGSGSGGTGGTLTVTAPAGVTVTISKDGKTKTKTADSNGQAVFKGLKTGTWTVTISDGSQTSPAHTVEIVTDYAESVSFFSATIAVTYPEGSTCTCSDGSTTLTAPDTSGSYTFTVPNAGAWTVSCTDGEDNESAIVTITTDGESQSVQLSWELDIFKDGKIAKGEVSYHIASSDGSYGDISYAKINEDGMLELRAVGPSMTMIGFTTERYDVTAYNKLVFKISKIEMVDGSGGTIYLGIASAQTDTQTVAYASFEATNVTDLTYTVDVSKITGEYYIKFMVIRGGTIYYGDTVYISEILLEDKP